MIRVATSLPVACLLLLAGCATTVPYDYSAFRERPPRSILILPPLNESPAVEATYGYLTTVTEPVAELGYYVFPVAVVDQFLKENGLPTAGEMHQVPLERVAETLGADAVLFITLEQYGSQYNVLSSTVTVKARARLVDTRTAIELWAGTGMAQQGSSSGSGNLLGGIIAAAVSQAINSGTDAAHLVSRQANTNMFMARGRGLPYGPYHPAYGKEP